MQQSLLTLVALATLVAAATPALATEPPRVVASIKPLHSLVAGVMEGVGEPHLFVSGGDSPHTYAMRPSDAEALARADAVFWIGAEFEGFLVRPIENLATEVRSVALIETPGLVLHDYEEEEEHDHGHGHGHGHGHAEPGHAHGHDHGEQAHAEEHQQEHPDAHGHAHAHEEEHGHDNAHRHDHVHEGTDGHIWLDPANARIMVGAIADTLSQIDPSNADVYAANEADLQERLSALETDIAARLDPHHDVAFFTFHDAFRYFAERFGLNSRGAITVSPERQPGAQRLAAIREEVGRSAHVCVFAEPQFPPALIDTVTEGTGARIGQVDPLGAEIPDGPDLYFELIEFNAAAFETCFAEASH